MDEIIVAVMPLDKYARNIHYLRISLTDRCNLRCVYCMPEDITFRPQTELIRKEEILRLAGIFAGLGVDKIRLTGGEPTVHPELVSIVSGLSHTPGIQSVTMTTNGVLLQELAEPLKAAGLQRVNISLDSNDPDEFNRIARRDAHEKVWKGILAAEKAGLTPVKLNAVIVRGHNDETLLDMAAMTLDHPWYIRFIEMMPFGGATEFQLHQVVTSHEVMERIESEFGKLIPENDGKLDGEAMVFKIPNSLGTLGFISSVTAPFCSLCTRTRLTSDGKLRLCLLREDEVDLLTSLRAGATDEDLRRLIVDNIWVKPWGHGLADGEVPVNRTMSEIGG